MFRGKLKINSRIVVTLSLDHASSGTASMVSSYGAAGGHATSKAVVIAPAGTGTTTHDLNGRGLFRIVVDMKSDRDTGHLEVKENGVVRDQANITGDTTWLYSVE